MQPLFLPQIHRAGCDGIITTFARPEFGFTMKQNLLRRLVGWWVCSQQPMNGRNGRRWRSVTTGRRFKVSLFIFTSPVLPQIRHWPVRKSHSFLAAIFFGTLMSNLGTHDGRGRNKVRLDKFPKGGKRVRTWGSIFMGSSSRPQTGGQTLTNEASKGGCLRRTGICPTHDR